MSETLRLGVDTGGTFTDFVVARGARITSFKVPSTPRNPAEAILAGLARAIAENAASPTEIVHGTTVATNALLEHKGARTALITTAGFEDVIEIGRQARPQLYNLMVMRPAPLVPRELRFGLIERIGPNGEIITPLDPASLADIVCRLQDFQRSAQPIESVAVCLLFSFANTAHEEAVSRALEPLAFPVSLSHRILPEYREYERTSTTVINAYLVPIMSRYLRALAGELRRIPLRVMQSNGGSVSAATAASEPVRAILSGPAGGVVGALRVCGAAGIRDIITFDMGGTSTDVALCRGEARTTNEALVAGLPVAVPLIDIHTVGAGGGSIARVDEAGALRVGPESAGADPGPACYGRGDEVTVTDANLVLGRFGGEALLGGAMTLDIERARQALGRLAAALSLHAGRRVSAERAALGIVSVANARMEAALRVVSIERGQDPRLFTLVSFGGAGGLHVCALAEALRIPRVFIPRSPGTLSALGVLLGDVVRDYSRTVMLKAGTDNRRAIEKAFATLERQGIRDLKHEGFDAQRIKLAQSIAMRYAGQSFEIDVPFTARFESRFHAAHRERYGYSDPARATEIVSLRLRATGVTDKPRLGRSTVKTHKITPRSVASVYLSERAARVSVYERDDFVAGTKLNGPAIIAEYSSTTLIPAGRTVAVDEWLNLIVT